MRAAVLLAALSGAAYAWQPTGSLDELWDDTLLPRLRPGVVAGGFSSYDRTGGNNDGFSGTYSKLREESGNSVIAEMDGPGCIYRMWFTHSEMRKDGLLNLEREHIRVYLDGASEPALDVPLESLFDGSLERFPKPIAGSGIGGFYSYVPIPYAKSCKVVIQGLGVRFYQINYLTFPSADGVKPFTMAMTNDEQASLKKAVALWSDPLGQLQSADGERIEIPVAHQPAGKEPEIFSHTIPAATGAAVFMLRGWTLEGVSAETLQDATVEIVADENTMRVPMAMYFGQAHDAPPYTSLMFGSGGDVLYNRVPVVYTKTCTIRLLSIFPIEAKLVAFRAALKGNPSEYGRLRAQTNEGRPTEPGVYHPFLRADGAGHVAGTYLVTDGPKGLPYWLEGDDRWTIDGELRIHGTGSEDYFNCGWYALPGRLNGPEALPSHGFPVYGLTDHTMRAAAFRWHFSDVVPFQQSIDFVIEHGEANRHIANYRSATFYYAP